MLKGGGHRKFWSQLLGGGNRCLTLTVLIMPGPVLDFDNFGYHGNQKEHLSFNSVIK